jgi:hypothetical protein
MTREKTNWREVEPISGHRLIEGISLDSLAIAEENDFDRRQI